MFSRGKTKNVLTLHSYLAASGIFDRSFAVREGVETTMLDKPVVMSNITYFTRFYRKQYPSISDFISASDTLTIFYAGFYSPDYFGVQLTVTVVRCTYVKQAIDLFITP